MPFRAGECCDPCTKYKEAGNEDVSMPFRAGECCDSKPNRCRIALIRCFYALPGWRVLRRGSLTPVVTRNRGFYALPGWRVLRPGTQLGQHGPGQGVSMPF